MLTTTCSLTTSADAKRSFSKVQSVTDTTAHSFDSGNCACWSFCTGI